MPYVSLNILIFHLKTCQVMCRVNFGSRVKIWSPGSTGWAEMRWFLRVTPSKEGWAHKSQGYPGTEPYPGLFSSHVSLWRFQFISNLVANTYPKYPAMNSHSNDIYSDYFSHNWSDIFMGTFRNLWWCFVADTLSELNTGNGNTTSWITID